MDGAGWVEAVDLRGGDVTVGEDGETVVSLHTSGAHTYFTALHDDELLVHDSACNIAMHGVTRRPGVHHIKFEDGGE